MYPLLFEYGPLVIRSYGVMIMLGIILGTFVALREGKRVGLLQTTILDFALYAVIAGIVGARLWHVANEWSTLYQDHPWEILAIWNGGLAIQGVVLGGIIVTVWYTKTHHLDFWRFADVGALGLILGQAIGRIGCTLNGCSYGVPANLPWSIYLAGRWRQPVQIYEFLADLAIFGLLWSLRRRKPFEGFLFLLYIISYSTVRITLDSLRADTDIVIYGLRWAQLAGMAGLTLGLLLLVWRYRQYRKETTIKLGRL
ncbi:MAG: prolipoprotein diacylglyceryl transferase [Chloroflexi bacterium]|nr:prolipoprotein diacylglyceryl transferase [Chloroflexota bacterium]MCL5075563.1 prolipoprotein diacylglyceryl transferase [Chloroflexota bacterium]